MEEEVVTHIHASHRNIAIDGQDRSLSLREIECSHELRKVALPGAAGGSYSKSELSADSHVRA